MVLNRPARHSKGLEDIYLVRLSRLACSACRRKKTKCDRTLPNCLLCTKLQQSCVYPDVRLKPGPKAVSSQRRPSTQLAGNETSRNNRWQGDMDGNFGDHGDDSIQPDSLRRESYTEFSREDLGADSDTPSSPDLEYNFVKALSLSSLIHPTHEMCLFPMPTVRDTASSSSLLDLMGAQNLLMQVSNVLDLSAQAFQRLTDAYFDNMTAFSLFHRPSFAHKIQNIKSPDHLQALFGAMFSFSARFQTSSSIDPAGQGNGLSGTLDYTRFHQQALKLIENSLNEMADQTPSLCLLQAMTLITFCELTNGVRGRAWRLVGSCVRVAYELHLHLIDYEATDECVKVGRDLAQWTADEERRRCWWAIWEMDNFASTIRRCPTAIDWTMIETYLPVPDEFWFNNQYHPSCFLETKPVDRSKMLRKRGNESPTAWLIVISSITRNAQVLLRGNLHGILLHMDPHDNTDQLLHYFRNSFCGKKTQEDSTKLNTLVHALQNVIADLPESLVYRGEYLDFGSNGQTTVSDIEKRRVHSAKYSIYLAIQFARFMIYHHYAFGEIVSGTIFSRKQNAPGPGWSPSDQELSENAMGLRNCLQAADNICSLTTRCPEDHVNHVNPFLASTVWLAASLQVLRKLFGNCDDQNDPTSKCERLRAVCERYTEFWHTPLSLLENLDTLEARLCHYSDPSPAATATDRIRRGSGSMTSSSTARRSGLQKTRYNPTADKSKSRLRPPVLLEDGLNTKSGFEGSSSVPYAHPKYSHVGDEAYRSAGDRSLFNFLPPSNDSSDYGTGQQSSNGSHDNSVPDFPSLNHYDPSHIVPATTDQDLFTSWEGQMDIDSQLNSQFSKHLLDLFSEPLADGGTDNNWGHLPMG